MAIDGDPNFSATLSTTVNNLVKGQSYNVSFLEAAGQQQPLNGATTEWWNVSLGTEHHPSTLMNNDSHNFVDWIRETLTFTAMDTTETLSFFAKGTPGGEPPIVLLDGVSVTAVSEPETYALLGVGLLGILAVRRQRKKRV